MTEERGEPSMADTASNLVEEHLASGQIATAAGQLLLEVRSSGRRGDDLKAAGDRAAHEFIRAELARRFPADAVLSEEDDDHEAPLDELRRWIVDPLDGTREFAELTRDDWAVHVALAIDGTATVGAVALPARNLTLTTADPPPMAPEGNGPPRIVVSRTRPPVGVDALTRKLGGELVVMGSAGAKAMSVVLGEAEIYVHSGGQHAWDNAAPVAVALSSGFHASRLDGSPLRYDDPWVPDLLICRPEFAGAVITFFEDLAA
jgi:3'(2'), 5'-bisphosphate nucleotidase